MTLSRLNKSSFLDAICIVIGVIMAYRSATELLFYDFRFWHVVLGIALAGGAVANVMMYHRQLRGYWLFLAGNVVVALVFIFVLEDVWHHHVWPHLAYAAVYLPFFGLLADPDPRDTVRDPPLHSRLLAWIVARGIRLLERYPALGRAIDAIGPLRRAINRLLIDRIAAAPLARPLPLGLWSSGNVAVPTADLGNGVPHETAASWPGMVERGFTGRHLPPAETFEVEGLPEPDAVMDLFERKGAMQESETSALFCFFAQWFTDSFLRTHPGDRRRSTSNHEIDLCQIYGLGEESTEALRDGRYLKSRRTDVGELPPLLALSDGTVDPDLARIAYDPIWATTYGEHDPPHGMAANLRDTLRDAIGCWPVTDERWKVHYAGGLERANSTIVYSAISTIFLREHNRLAREIGALHPDWPDSRVFETARNVNIVKLLKIIVEDYINHLASSPLKIFVEQGWADRRPWYRANRISLEFNLLYRWHSMVPSEFVLDGAVLPDQQFRFNNTHIERLGVEPIIDAAAKQRAGKLTLGNTPEFLMNAERNSLLFARKFRLRSFNAYRAHWRLRPYDSFEALTGGDGELAASLAKLYPDRNGIRGVDRVELTVGLFAESRTRRTILPPLMLSMVGSDAFSQALTNPLLAVNIFGSEVFSEWGLKQIEETSSFADVVARNTAEGTRPPRAAFTLPFG